MREFLTQALWSFLPVSVIVAFGALVMYIEYMTYRKGR